MTSAETSPADVKTTGTTTSTSQLRRRPRRLLAALDIVAGVAASGIAYLIMALRSGPHLVETLATSILDTLIIIMTIGMLAWSGSYSSQQRISRISDTGTLTRGMLMAFAVASLLSLATKGFFTGITGPSRLAVGSFLIMFWVLGVATRFVVSWYQRRLFAHGVGVRKIMVLGTGPQAQDVMDFVQARPWLGVVVAGRLCLEGADGCVDQGLAGSKHLGSEQAAADAPPLMALATSLDGLRRLSETMRILDADEVVVALEAEESGKLPQITGFLSLVRVPFKIVPSLFEETAFLGGPDDITPAHVLEMAVDPPDRLVQVVKRVSDICISLLALLLLLLITPGIALAIAAETGRPVYYRQERLGKYGKRFNILKFRTMVVGADSLLDDLKEQDEGDGPHFKMTADPRLTRVGAFLRRWSLDELPQFWNVLKGDMSVVGPRPPLLREVAQYETPQMVRLKGKPGITGLWQVSGRKNLTFDDMVRLDRYYLENWSLKMDMSIILRTFSAVLTRRGAY
jgi:exopolysaccharide biosynthesis polyprenyl glycosylphosphotransferase